MRRINLADGAPFARVTVWCPEALGSGLSLNDVEARPFHDLLADAGVVVAGARQSIAAGAAGHRELLLEGLEFVERRPHRIGGRVPPETLAAAEQPLVTELLESAAHRDATGPVFDTQSRLGGKESARGEFSGEHPRPEGIGDLAVSGRPHLSHTCITLDSL